MSEESQSNNPSPEKPKSFYKEHSEAITISAIVLAGITAYFSYRIWNATKNEDKFNSDLVVRTEEGLTQVSDGLDKINQFLETIIDENDGVEAAYRSAKKERKVSIHDQSVKFEGEIWPRIGFTNGIISETKDKNNINLSLFSFKTIANISSLNGNIYFDEENKAILLTESTYSDRHFVCKLPSRDTDCYANVGILISPKKDRDSSISVTSVTTIWGTDDQINIYPTKINGNLDFNPAELSKLATNLENLFATIERYRKFTEETKKTVDMETAKPQKAQANSLYRNTDFSKKLQGGEVEITMQKADWHGGRSTCTGWIISKNAIGTARHCVEDNETSRLLVKVDGFVPTGTQTIIERPIYIPKYPSEYAITMSGNDDLAVIVTDSPKFPGNCALTARQEPIVSGSYLTGHFAGYSTPPIWKIDTGGLLGNNNNEAVARFVFNFQNQGGNSGGPIVDSKGHVVSLHARTCNYKESADDWKLKSCGPSITQAKLDDLISQAQQKFTKKPEKKKINPRNK